MTTPTSLFPHGMAIWQSWRLRPWLFSPSPSELCRRAPVGSALPTLSAACRSKGRREFPRALVRRPVRVFRHHPNRRRVSPLRRGRCHRGSRCRNRGTARSAHHYVRQATSARACTLDRLVSKSWRLHCGRPGPSPSRPSRRTLGQADTCFVPLSSSADRSLTEAGGNAARARSYVAIIDRTLLHFERMTCSIYCCARPALRSSHLR